MAAKFEILSRYIDNFSKDDIDKDKSSAKGQIDFKSNLKKTSSELKPSEVDNNIVVDFKVKLKKPSKSTAAEFSKEEPSVSVGEYFERFDRQFMPNR